MNGRLLALLLPVLLFACAVPPAPSSCSPALRDESGRIARNHTAVAQFKRLNPCPANGARSGPCPGYVVDHVIPLCHCGADEPSNMQWQTVEEAKVKDRWERRICGTPSLPR